MAGLFAAAPAAAEDVSVTRGTCAHGVHLVARDARFSDVLSRLAQALDFELTFESVSNPIVSFDLTAQPRELLSRVMPGASISTIEAGDPRCPHQTRILKLWVLSASESGQLPAVQPPAPVTITETPEQKRQVQEGLALHMKAHGFDPDAAKIQRPTAPTSQLIPPAVMSD
jgi:hypothetical protein